MIIIKQTCNQPKIISLQRACFRDRQLRSLNGDQGIDRDQGRSPLVRAGDGLNAASLRRSPSGGPPCSASFLSTTVPRGRTPNAPCAAAKSAEVTFGRSARNSVTAAAAVSPIIPTSGSLSSNCAPGLRHESASREMRPLPQTARADLPSLLANAVLFIDVRDGLCATARAGYTEKIGRDLMRRNRGLDHRRPRPRRAKICNRRDDCGAGKRTSLRRG